MMEPQTPSLYAILQVDPKASSRESKFVGVELSIELDYTYATSGHTLTSTVDAAYARLRRGKGSDKEGYKALKRES